MDSAVKLRHHANLTPESWNRFPFEKQVLMIGNELHRAKNWIQKEDYAEVKHCYERAFELLFLSIGNLKEPNKIREFTRFYEALAGLYVKKEPDAKANRELLMVLILMDRKSYSPALAESFLN